MTRANFFNALINAGITQDKPPQILLTLFQRSGYYTEKTEGISEATATAWIKKKRTFKVSKYFLEGKISEPNKLFNYFRRRNEENLAKLQEIFRKEKDGSSPIDCETKDWDRFCWSLVNQFCDLFDLERVDLPAPDVSQENMGGIEAEINRNADAQENIDDIGEAEISRNADAQENIDDIDEAEIDRNADAQENSVVAPKEENCQANPHNINSGAQISIPQDCRVCFCCKNWNGDVKAAYRNIADEYGECKVLGKRISSINGACNTFIENYNKITLYVLWQKSFHN